MISKHSDLRVVEKAHRLVLGIYKLSKSFPREERYRLVDQLCRSAASVPANIVEGNSRQTNKEFVQFLYQAKGSLAETQYHLLLARDFGYLHADVYRELIVDANSVGKMISGLISYKRSRK